MENTVQTQNTTIKAVKIPRIAEYKAKQELFVQNHPFIPCIDAESYKKGKVTRTKYVTERTSIEKHVDGVNKDINTLKNNLKDFKDELINVTLVHEQKQQAEVKRYEQQKKDEKAEKIRLAEEEKQIDIDKVNAFFLPLIKMVLTLIFDEIEVIKQDIGRQIREKEIEGGFGEAEELFISTKNTLIEKLTEKIQSLTIKESQRVEDERIAEERRVFEEQKAKDKAEKEAQEKRETEKKAEEDALRKAEDEKRAEDQRKLDEEKAEFEAKKKADQKAIDDEKERIAKVETDRLAKIEKENQAKLKAEKEKKEAEEKEAKVKADKEAEEKRQLALRPDVEKLETAINQISFSIQELSQTSSKQFQQDIIQRLESLKEELINELQNL